VNLTIRDIRFATVDTGAGVPAFYLAGSEMSFRTQGLMNFQIQLTRRHGVMPMTRDYIGRDETRLRSVERGRRPKLQLAGEKHRLVFMDSVSELSCEG
jgi:hypothetical protein